MLVWHVSLKRRRAAGVLLTVKVGVFSFWLRHNIPPRPDGLFYNTAHVNKEEDTVYSLCKSGQRWKPVLPAVVPVWSLLHLWDLQHPLVCHFLWSSEEEEERHWLCILYKTSEEEHGIFIVCLWRTLVSSACALLRWLDLLEAFSSCTKYTWKGHEGTITIDVWNRKETWNLG